MSSLGLNKEVSFSSSIDGSKNTDGFHESTRRTEDALRRSSFCLTPPNDDADLNEVNEVAKEKVLSDAILAPDDRSCLTPPNEEVDSRASKKPRLEPSSNPQSADETEADPLFPTVSASQIQFETFSIEGEEASFITLKTPEDIRLISGNTLIYCKSDHSFSLFGELTIKLESGIEITKTFTGDDLNPQALSFDSVSLKLSDGTQISGVNFAKIAAVSQLSDLDERNRVVFCKADKSVYLNGVLALDFQSGIRVSAVFSLHSYYRLFKTQEHLSNEEMGGLEMTILFDNGFELEDTFYKELPVSDLYSSEECPPPCLSFITGEEGAQFLYNGPLDSELDNVVVNGEFRDNLSFSPDPHSLISLEFPDTYHWKEYEGGVRLTISKEGFSFELHDFGVLTMNEIDFESSFFCNKTSYGTINCYNQSNDLLSAYKGYVKFDFLQGILLKHGLGAIGDDPETYFYKDKDLTGRQSPPAAQFIIKQNDQGRDEKREPVRSNSPLSQVSYPQ